jgi:hypothetical protein
LLVDVGGRLFIDMNDSAGHARIRLIRKIARQYRHSYVLRLSGYGDADMVNFFDLEGKRVERHYDPLVGRWLSQYAQRIGAKSVIPFSSFHQYQREDSAWANAYTTPLFAYREGFDERLAEFIDPFVWIDCASGEVLNLDPPKTPRSLHKPEEFGDSWSDELNVDDKRLLEDYFRRKEALYELLGFLTFTVGGKSHTIDLGGPSDRGVTFETPRNSLMSAVTCRVFDDLLGGNFMKTTLHNVQSLYDPNFTYLVTKFGDNGCAETKSELEAYLAEYKRRAGADWVLHHFARDGQTLFRRYVSNESKLYNLASDIYRTTLRS